MMTQYGQVYQALRDRIVSGEFEVGARLPSISALQQEYGIPSLNTVRAAQQMLVEDGMIETHQGRGAFVVSTTSARLVDVDETLAAAARQIEIARTAYAAQKTRRVTIDLDHPDYDDAYFVLTESIRAFVGDLEHRRDERFGSHVESTDGQIAAGNWMLELIDRALSGTAAPAR